jgi:hypothetical protein
MTTASIDRRELVLALRAVRAQSDGQVQGVEPRAFETPLFNATRLCDWAFAQGGLERGAATRRPSTMRPVAATCLFFALLLGLQRAALSASFPPIPLVSALSAARTGPLENRSMKFAKSLVVASSALLASGGALAQDAVQWRVEDGGNGHWYQGRRLSESSYVSWTAARAHAMGSGADLVSLNDEAEVQWVYLHVANQPNLWSLSSGPWIGAFQTIGSSEPYGGWMWVDGTALPGAFPWTSTQPDNATYCGAAENFAFYWFGEGNPQPANRFADLVESGYCIDRAQGDWVTSAIFEWSSDCNSDGLVDYGQIRAGELEDTNANNIPDCCEQAVPCDPCAADVDESGVVSGVDLAAVLGAWGTSGGKYPRADINGDGVVDGADLAAVLNGWGPCP